LEPKYRIDDEIAKFIAAASKIVLNDSTISKLLSDKFKSIATLPEDNLPVDNGPVTTSDVTGNGKKRLIQFLYLNPWKLIHPHSSKNMKSMKRITLFSTRLTAEYFQSGNTNSGSRIAHVVQKQTHKEGHSKTGIKNATDAYLAPIPQI
jgi:hypothetical protein